MKTLTDMVEYTADEAAQDVRIALASIVEARKELDRIETQLQLAAAGEPFLRIGDVRGVSAQALFNAFSSIETAALMAKHVGENELVQRLRPENSVADGRGGWVVSEEHGRFPDADWQDGLRQPTECEWRHEAKRLDGFATQYGIATPAFCKAVLNRAAAISNRQKAHAFLGSLENENCHSLREDVLALFNDKFRPTT